MKFLQPPQQLSNQVVLLEAHLGTVMETPKHDFHLFLRILLLQLHNLTAQRLVLLDPHLLSAKVA
jgi:hypothetical protein